jgi:hypothetical protein
VYFVYFVYFFVFKDEQEVEVGRESSARVRVICFFPKVLSGVLFGPSSWIGPMTSRWNFRARWWSVPKGKKATDGQPHLHLVAQIRPCHPRRSLSRTLIEAV